MVKTVAVAGTFNIFHKGHEKLLAKAFEIGCEVHIGLTSDEMAQEARGVTIQSYETREKHLTEAATLLSKGKLFSIVKITDSLGPAAISNYDAIIVSKGTKDGAEAINQARERAGLKPLEIIEIKMVLAEDKQPITSSRVIMGEIDKNGAKKNL